MIYIDLLAGGAETGLRAVAVRKRMAQVDLEKVSKVYPGGVRAVDQVTLDIADREFVVLVGPSGCGKSTTLRMVAGLEEISEGLIRIDGRVVNDVAPKDRDIAMVFQNYALYPHMTVYKNMAFGLKLRGVPRREIDRKVREAARLLGIEDLLDRKPRALSGGQRQRVAVGRAIVRNPKAFLFDEPLSNLDAKLRVEMRAELKKLHRRLATTTIYVTHDQEEAMTLGDRVVVMKDGRVQQVGRPLEVYDHPVNRFVAGFLGTPPMNFLDGRVIRQNGHLYFDEGSCRVRLPERLASRLSEHEGRPMTLGVRPEDISDRADGPFAGQENSLPVRVTVVEPLGDRMDAYLQTAAHDHIVCRVDAHSRIEEGMTLTMHLDMNRVHLFEPGELGRNVSLNGTGA